MDGASEVLGMTSIERLRVLVVDDHSDTVKATALLLSLDGHDVLCANGGATGVAMAYQHQPDVILLDLAMPEMDGYQVARELQNLPLTPEPYLVAVTGYGMDADKRRCAAAGFDLHLTKPIPPEVYDAGRIGVVHKGTFSRIDRAKPRRHCHPDAQSN